MTVHQLGKSLLSVTAIGVMLVDARAQTPAPRPAFEVASIKRNPGLSSGNTFAARPGGSLRVVNNELTNVIDNAYGVRRYQLIGGPDWIESDHYDIEAKAEGDPPREQMMAMLQSLLEERFKLRVHRETRQLPIYVLTAARGGIKLPPSPEGSCVVRDPRNPPAPRAAGQPPPVFCGNNNIRTNAWNATRIDMSGVAGALVGVLGRSVIDRTGFAGTFDIHVTWTPDQAPAGVDGPGGDNSAPSLFTVLQEQLGLKVESAKGPVDVLIIDHVERPTDD